MAEPVTDLVRVQRVIATDTRVPDLRLFIVEATLVARPSQLLQLQTVNGYAATLCQRAKDLSRSIAVTHERTRYGETLTSAHFLKVEIAS